MTQPQDDTADIVTDGQTVTFVAVAAGQYEQADTALWRARGAGVTGPAAERHLEMLRDRRKEAYFNLVQWVMQAESERQSRVEA